MPITESYPRDANNVPITTDGLVSTNSQTLSGSNTTVNTALFRITGTIEVRGLWAVVTTVIGANHTGGLYRLNDQTAQVAITATGATLSGLAVGTTITKKGLAAAALTLLDNAAGRVSEPTTLETTYFSPFVVMKKTGANTDIEYQYATTDTPTSGVLKHFLRWLPLSQDANVVIV
jgi:hypothetical protein